MNSPNQKTSFPLPIILVVITLLGGAMFVLGRSTAPHPGEPAQTATTHASESGENTEAQGESGEGEEAQGEGKSIVFSSEALKSSGIKVAPVSIKPQLVGMPFNGEIEATPDNVARVASVVPGRVTRLYVAIGQQVRKGQTLALIESRSVGEAQSAYDQAQARLQNARSAYDVTVKQAKAGVFSRTPLETAERAFAEAQSQVREQETAVQSAQLALDNVTRLAKMGSFARPSLEAARSQYDSAIANLKTAQASQDNAKAAIQSAQMELAKRRQIAQNGGYSSQPVEQARRALVAAQAAVATAQSEVSTTRASLNRNTSLLKEGLVATKDVEAAQAAFDTANAHLQSATAEADTAAKEFERQQKLATTNVASNAEVSDAQAKLTQAYANERTQRAEATKAQSLLQLAKNALNREQKVFEANIANRREFSQARSNLANAQTGLTKARQTFHISEIALQREQRIYRQNLNTIAQVQSVQSSLVSAQSDFRAAQTALSLLKSAPGSSAVVPLRAPLTGIVQTRDITEGEVIEADKNLITVVNLSTVHVDMNLPERDISRVQVGAPVQIQVDALSGQTFVGHVELIHTELDPKSRTLEAHAEIANPGNLRIGMFARGKIGSGKQNLAVMVPAEAVQDLEDRHVVFIAGEKQGEFLPRDVETGPTANGETLIENGLKPGEKIVIVGAFMVKAQSMKGELAEED